MDHISLMMETSWEQSRPNIISQTAVFHVPYARKQIENNAEPLQISSHSFP